MKVWTSHGHTKGLKKSPTYVSWRKMCIRCTNPRHNKYPVYGGAGVRVCERWRDFRNFLADMGVRPEGTTLGRILDRGDYEPGNCFWMTWAEQGLSRRNNNALLKWQGLPIKYKRRATKRPPHGHSFKVDVSCSGPVQEDGMVLDFADIKTAFSPLHEALDHRLLNEVGGILHNPTSENIAYWIWHRLKERLPMHIKLKVSVHETCTSGCTYDGQ